MIVGKAATGKTTLFRVMKDVSKILNKMEFNVLQKAFLKQKAGRMGIPYTLEEDGEVIKLDPNLPAEITKAFLPTLKENKLIEDTQNFLDLNTQNINPKSLDLQAFHGIYNKENNDWQDGCLTNMFRNAVNDKSTKIKLLILDGPVDHSWFECLNSVLDQNKQLYFG
jgi:hypothetical protein